MHFTMEDAIKRAQDLEPLFHEFTTKLAEQSALLGGLLVLVELTNIFKDCNAIGRQNIIDLLKVTTREFEAYGKAHPND